MSILPPQLHPLFSAWDRPLAFPKTDRDAVAAITPNNGGEFYAVYAGLADILKIPRYQLPRLHLDPQAVDIMYVPPGTSRYSNSIRIHPDLVGALSAEDLMTSIAHELGHAHSRLVLKTSGESCVRVDQSTGTVTHDVAHEEAIKKEENHADTVQLMLMGRYRVAKEKLAFLDYRAAQDNEQIASTGLLKNPYFMTILKDTLGSNANTMGIDLYQLMGTLNLLEDVRRMLEGPENELISSPVFAGKDIPASTIPMVVVNYDRPKAYGINDDNLSPAAQAEAAEAPFAQVRSMVARQFPEDPQAALREALWRFAFSRYALIRRQAFSADEHTCMQQLSDSERVEYAFEKFKRNYPAQMQYAPERIILRILYATLTEGNDGKVCITKITTPNDQEIQAQVEEMLAKPAGCHRLSMSELREAIVEDMMRRCAFTKSGDISFDNTHLFNVAEGNWNPDIGLHVIKRSREAWAGQTGINRSH